ncbi:MAG: ABC transporter ATP-binding protein [Promethearchaeota archaeon]
MMDTLNNSYEIWTHMLTKVYGKGVKQVKAVDAINIAMEPGIHGFLGPNGAGKTSTINMLVGAISVTGGTAKIRSFRIGSIKSRRLVGFLPQDPAFYENMTGPEYLLYIAQLNGLRRHHAKNKIKQLMEFLDLEEAIDREIGKYSGGMKQKIGIAAALIHDPDILILDEPTANLDPLGRADLISKIKELSKRMSVFVSSHILSEVEQMCERVFMINKGRIIIDDTIKNIKQLHTNYSNIFILDTESNDKMLQILKSKDYVANAFIRDDDDKIMVMPTDNRALQSELPQILIQNNFLLKSFYQQEASLQDIFIEIIQGDDSNVQ